MHVIAITPPYFYPGEADAIAQALCERGFWRVHIRKPGASPERMRQLLEAVPAGLRPRLSVHDCFGLARELGIGGVHLNSRNPVAPDGWNGITSRSLHSVDEIAGISDDYFKEFACNQPFVRPDWCSQWHHCRRANLFKALA